MFFFFLDTRINEVIEEPLLKIKKFGGFGGNSKCSDRTDVSMTHRLVGKHSGDGLLSVSG